MKSLFKIALMSSLAVVAIAATALAQQQPVDDRYYPMPDQTRGEQSPSPQEGPQAVLSCNIDYTGPDGSNVIKIVNQKLKIPLATNVIYYDSMQIGERQLDYSAENANGRKMVGLTLWYVSGKGTVCDTNKPDVATCAFKAKNNQEQANIVCRRER